MLYGNIGAKSRRQAIVVSTRFFSAPRASTTGGGEDENAGQPFRMSLAPTLEHMENFFSQRQSIQLNIPKQEEERESDNQGTLDTLQSKLIGNDLWETLYLNSTWFIRCFRFLVYYTVGILYYSNIEGWCFQDCVNFITQTMTTVGYGNITPLTANGQTFTSFYAVSGMLLVFSSLNDIASFIIEIVRNRYRKPQRLNKLQVIVRSVLNMLMWIMILFLIPVIGALIFSTTEGWDFHQAFYFSVITSTSVGYGDLNVTQSLSVWLNLIYILIACSLTGIALNKISSFKRHLNEAELQQILNEIEPSNELIDAIDKSDPLKITRNEYILHMLQLEGKLDYRNDILRWSKRFTEFDMDRDNYLTMHDVITFHEHKQMNAFTANMNTAANEMEEGETTGAIAGGGELGFASQNNVRRGSTVPFSNNTNNNTNNNDSSSSSFSEYTSASSMSSNSSGSGSGSHSATNSPHKIKRKKSLLTQITLETRNVILETIYPQALSHKSTKDNVADGSNGNNNNNGDEEEEKKKETISLQSAIALRRASSTLNTATGNSNSEGNGVELSSFPSPLRRGSSMNTNSTSPMRRGSAMTDNNNGTNGTNGSSGSSGSNGDNRMGGLRRGSSLSSNEAMRRASAINININTTIQSPSNNNTNANSNTDNTNNNTATNTDSNSSMIAGSENPLHTTININTTTATNTNNTTPTTTTS